MQAGVAVAAVATDVATATTAADTAAAAAAATTAVAAVAAAVAATAAKEANYPFPVVGTLNHTRVGGPRPGRGASKWRCTSPLPA